jgi:hypothetical protein
MRYYMRLSVFSALALFFISCGNGVAGFDATKAANGAFEVAGNGSQKVTVDAYYADQAEITKNEYRDEVAKKHSGFSQDLNPEYKYASDSVSSPPPPPADPLQLKAQVKNPDMIIKTGSMDITVDDYAKAIPSIQNLIKGSNGYIQSENESTDNWAKRNNIVIRVPAANFEKLMNSIGGIARNVLNRNVNTDDVSEEYYDTEARKKAQQAAANRYIELLKQAKNVEEVMAVQSKIDAIQEEVDSKEGRLRYLRDQVGYSTITLSVAQNYDYKPIDGPGFGSRMGSAFGNGWQGFLNFLIIVANLWPLWIILAAAYFIIRKIVKRFLKKKQA